MGFTRVDRFYARLSLTMQSTVVPYVLNVYYAWGKYAYFNAFYNGYKRTEQLWCRAHTSFGRRRPSVRLSVTSRCRFATNERRITWFSPPRVANALLFFRQTTFIPQTRETFRLRTSNETGVRKMQKKESTLSTQ